ncbi:MAG: hypothetical protein GWP15_03930 [Nitrospirae bacterium]|nr:hypothetical protein [Nitrospirota bacterium]
MDPLYRLGKSPHISQSVKEGGDKASDKTAQKTARVGISFFEVGLALLVPVIGWAWLACRLIQSRSNPTPQKADSVAKEELGTDTKSVSSEISDVVEPETPEDIEARFKTECVELLKKKDEIFFEETRRSIEEATIEIIQGTLQEEMAKHPNERRKTTGFIRDISRSNFHIEWDNEGKRGVFDGNKVEGKARVNKAFEALEAGLFPQIVKLRNSIHGLKIRMRFYSKLGDEIPVAIINDLKQKKTELKEFQKKNVNWFNLIQNICTQTTPNAANLAISNYITNLIAEKFANITDNRLRFLLSQGKPVFNLSLKKNADGEIQSVMVSCSVVSPFKLTDETGFTDIKSLPFSLKTDVKFRVAIQQSQKRIMITVSDLTHNAEIIDTPQEDIAVEEQTQ